MLFFITAYFLGLPFLYTLRIFFSWYIYVYQGYTYIYYIYILYIYIYIWIYIICIYIYICIFIYPYKKVCYKELIGSLTKSLRLYLCDLFHNIFYISCNFQIKPIKTYPAFVHTFKIVLESATTLCMDYIYMNYR